MKKIEKFVTFDGKEFNSYKEAADYELLFGFIENSFPGECVTGTEEVIEWLVENKETLFNLLAGF